MAARKRITPGDLLVEKSELGASYCGTRAQLIAAGLARAGDFPGDPESGRSTEHTFERDDRRIRICIYSRVACPMTYRLHVSKTKAECRARDLARRREWRARTDAETSKARQDAEQLLAKLPQTSDEYRRRMAASFEHLVDTLLRPFLATGGEHPSELAALLTGGAGGFRLSRESIEEFDDAVAEALDVLRNATVRVDGAARKHEVNRVRAKAAQSDPSFGRFMRGLISTPTSSNEAQ